MKNKPVVCLWLLFFVLGALQAQDKETVPVIEKVYLHTDRSTYFLGEDLWYKAYNVNAYNHVLTDNSNVLYVELISPDSKIILRHKTNLEMGLGHGDFKLTDSVGVKPGVYQLRAYTNWNRNYGDDFVFKKNIEIIDVFQSHFNAEASETKSDSEIVIEDRSQNTFNIDFFPEGGSLLENVTSVVGFKAVDVNGFPVDIEGGIYNSDNQKITSFSSVHDGMGKFQMIPLQGKSYYAIVKLDSGEEVLQDLPDILKEGYLLSFKRFKGRNILSVNTNQYTLSQNPSQKLKLVCKSRGIKYLESELELKETTLSFELPSKELSEGISQITLYDSQSRPQSERLVYVEKGHDLNVTLKMNKPTYQPNENVIIAISSISKSGEPKSGSYSLSVTDTNGVEEDKDYGSTICSYFLMESDIRGEVFHPNHYFNPENPKRLEHLDNLLLTQGWRDFLWKTQPKRNDTINYKAEKGFTISGKVKQLLGKKPLVNNNVTLALMNNSNFNAFSATTDSLGAFQFKDLMFSGKANIQLNSRNEKGRYAGEILLDSIDHTPIKTSFKYTLKRFPNTNANVENVYKKYVAFGVQPENILDEVEIVGEKRNDIIVYHGIADNTYVADEDTKILANIYEVLQTKIPGVNLSTGTGGLAVRYPNGRYILFFNRYETEPLILIDGFPIVDKTQLEDVDPDEIEKIEAIRGAQAMAYYGEEGSSGLIAVYTKRHLGNKPKKDAGSTIKKEIEGFYEARKFYEPNKPNNKLDNKKSQARNTIYWEPYIHPDKKGKAMVNYYNANVETKVKVSLEGISSNGIPVVKKLYYTINK